LVWHGCGGDESKRHARLATLAWRRRSKRTALTAPAIENGRGSWSWPRADGDGPTADMPDQDGLDALVSLVGEQREFALSCGW